MPDDQPTAITIEDVRRKEAEVRSRLAATRTADEGGPTTASDSLRFVDRTTDCAGCGASFTYPSWTGSVRLRLRCDDCLAAEEQRMAQERAERAAAERVAEIHSLIEAAGANPTEHGTATLDNFDAADCGPRPVRLTREFVADTKAAGRYDPVRGLYLHGGTGTGKTHLAVAVLRELLSDPAWPLGVVLYDHAAELIARIQNTYGGHGDTFALLEQRFRARVWILDDLGTERASDDVARHLTLIFTRRALRPTMVTSNLAPAEMEKQRPELARVLSRLGPAYFRHARVHGRDRRFD